ncbi:phage tail assembly chaperone [Blastomonas marina]|uniref:Phage tail assembly chaperone n=1 Tax=Blastomonas marina TaxID=1867408 RepID=A0ABQ1FHH9_9SPHN|nr:phage tail assembly chaperone [Blastomonas marina]WPZ03325.1 phage tail assembly chaperone [Blastomonas marina]GGA11112.1 hypothetical protein GCM10010923_22160 [Blastomonas marina]
MNESWAEVTRIAWPVAARVLHWAPAQFWGATPAELLGALADPGAQGAPLDRNEMTALMEADDGR